MTPSLATRPLWLSLSCTHTWRAAQSTTGPSISLCECSSRQSPSLSPAT
uniref:Uncharacterized protein n=1 Tax=Anguilla anguilla TaxID=7936 RepID=A0A0E9VDR1_ANGAN